MSLKNPVTPPRIDPGTVRLVAQRLNHYATQAPQHTVPYHNCIYNRLPEDEVSGSKHVEDKKIKNQNIYLVTVNVVGLCFTSSYFFAWYKPTDFVTDFSRLYCKRGDKMGGGILLICLLYIFDTDNGSGLGGRRVNYH